MKEGERGSGFAGRSEPTGAERLAASDRSEPTAIEGVETRLREMAESGELSGLPGEGKPLPTDDSGGDRWAAVHAMKNAGVVPEWSELRKEIDARLDALVARARRHLAWLRSREAYVRQLPGDRILEAARQTRESDARVREDLASALGDLNALVRRYDLIVPLPALQLVPYTLEQVISAAERRIRPRRDPGR